jgi:uncharacterized protein (TIGR01777 family)
MKVLIAGASGYIGSQLCRRLKLSGNEIVALERHKNSLENVDRVAKWDGKTVDRWIEELEAADALINLSGKNIAVPWTASNKEEIAQSRVGTTQLLAEACLLVSVPPKVWINSSAIGIYKPNLEELLTESGPKAEGFMGGLAQDWEAAMFEADLPETRRVAIRTAVVLGHGGGAFDIFVKLVKWFVGGSAGSGKQWMSWIHIEDLIRVFEWALNNPEVHGPINACAPEPARNKVFMAELRKAYGRPWAPPAPAFLIKLYGMLGGPDPSLVLDGYRVVPKNALDAGFEFRFPTLKEALSDLVPKR